MYLISLQSGIQDGDSDFRARDLWSLLTIPATEIIQKISIMDEQISCCWDIVRYVDSSSSGLV